MKHGMPDGHADRRDFWAALVMFGATVVLVPLSLRYHGLYPGFVVGVLTTIAVFAIAGRLK